MPNVVDNEELYNVVVLAGAVSPGTVRLSGHDRKRVWDVKFGPFLNGATTTLKGVPPIEFSASFYLVKDVAQGIDDYAAWDTWVKVVNSTALVTSPLTGAAQQQPKAQDIYHPDLAANDIKSVVNAQVGGFVYDGKGGATVVVKFQEYRPPRKYGGTPIGAKRSGPDPNAAAKAQLDALTKQFQATPWG